MCECFSPDDPTTGGGGLALGRCEFVKGVVLIKGPHARECMGVSLYRRCGASRGVGEEWGGGYDVGVLNERGSE